MAATGIIGLEQRLEQDEEFRRRFDQDPVVAAQAAGMAELAEEMQRELDELVRIGEEIGERAREDESYRELAAEHPARLLLSAGVAVPAVEPILRALDVPEEALAELPEVEAHLFQATTKARLLVLLATTTAFAAFAQDAFGAIAWGSDERLKERIEPIESALGRLRALTLR